MFDPPLRLRLDGEALRSNWNWLKAQSPGADCGAAIKADGYGLGARAVMEHLADAGCRDFFVATCGEAAALGSLPDHVGLSVLHGIGPDDRPDRLGPQVRPVLNSREQVERWRGSGRACDAMVDTGINRLGLSAEEVTGGILDGLDLHTLHSHLACADEDVPANMAQRNMLAGLGAKVGARRLSLANSAGICIGPDYAFDLTRPGLALYGGIPRREAEGQIRQVVRIEARIVQRRRIAPGAQVGYNATFTASAPHELAILNIGYADGYLRGFSGTGRARIGEHFAPVVGRVSMDLTAICVDAAPDLREGDWVELDFDLPRAAAQSGLSQYELLTSLGNRSMRIWN